MAKKTPKKQGSQKASNFGSNVLAILAIVSLGASGYMGYDVYQNRTADREVITEATELSMQAEDLGQMMSEVVEGGSSLLDEVRALRVEAGNQMATLMSVSDYLQGSNSQLYKQIRSLSGDWSQVESQIELVESFKPQIAGRFDLRTQITDQINALGQRVSRVTANLVKNGGTAQQVFLLSEQNRILRDLEASVVEAGDSEMQKQAGLVRSFRQNLALLMNGDGEINPVSSAAVRGQITQLAQLYSDLRTRFENLYSTSSQIDRAKKAADISGRLSSAISTDLNMVAQGVSNAEQNRPINAGRTLMAGGAGVFLLAFFIVASVRSNAERAKEADTSRGMLEEGNRRRQEEMQKLISEMHPLTAGDLTTEASENGAFTKQIAQVFNKAIASLRDTVNRLQLSSMEIASAAEQSHRTSENLKVVRKRSEQMQDSTSTLAEKMDKIITKISTHASETAASSAESAQAVESGRKSVETTHRAVEVADTSIRVSADMVKKLGEEIQQIESITMAIREITDNLQSLSYNTQLIADRSVGDEKDSISATADKMESLAKTVFGSLEEITHIVNGISGRTAETQSHIEKSRGDFVDLVKNSNTTLRAFELIGDATTKSHENVRQIESEAQQLTTTSQRFIDNISEIRSLSRDSSAATEETTEAINKLANLSGVLKDEASKFRTGRASGIEDS